MKIEICVLSKNDYETVKGIFSDINDIIVSRKSIIDTIYPIIVSAGQSSKNYTSNLYTYNASS